MRLQGALPSAKCAQVVAWLALTAAAAATTDAIKAVDAHLVESEALHSSGDTKRAAQELRRAEQLVPAAGVASFELGNVLFAPLQMAAERSTHIDEALAAEAERAFRAAIAADESDAAVRLPARLRTPIGMAYNNLANLLSVRRRYDEAEAMLRVGLRVQPIAYQYNGLASLLLQKSKRGGRGGGGESAGGSSEGGDEWYEDRDGSIAPLHPEAADLALLNEAASLLELAITHERNECPAGPKMESAYRGNLAQVLTRLGRTMEADVQLAGAQRVPRAAESASTTNGRIDRPVGDATPTAGERASGKRAGMSGGGASGGGASGGGASGGSASGGGESPAAVGGSSAPVLGVIGAARPRMSSCRRAVAMASAHARAVAVRSLGLSARRIKRRSGNTSGAVPRKMMANSPQPGLPTATTSCQSASWKA